ncbi:PREDICTED: putative tRNA (cytidine(34)-2'-O)-methyltransferase [Theobroma cacao]|uniref:tRNA (Cytidine(34)-2'-O)-methyltransferase n=1 Tax=Theobroma cacao TaxID=3641 RepID=A0AB32VS21_THECC|nr:PREDICTED: putative tRNA (cytidine(34)-2'-O)-methyltransferase [Theobroma cacao]
MERGTLKSLNAVTATPLRSHFLSYRPSLIASFYGNGAQKPKTKFHPALSFQRRSPLCSMSETGNGNSLPGGIGKAVSQLSQNKLLQVVLVSPQIPGNVGCIARTCAASAVGVHLVGPLGFKVDDTKLKRAGLDYWPYVVVRVHHSWTEFQDYFKQQEGKKRLLAFTKRGTAIHSDFSYRKGDYLIFGSETCGLPPDVLLDCKSETFGGGTIRIPMVDTYVRCLNLSVSVGIALYEASRQLNYEQLQGPSGNCSDTEQSFLTEDIFA